MSTGKATDKMLRMQRDLSLRLYKSIMRSHRALPEGIRDVGDVYVREEFKLHKTAKPEHLGPFFEQWIDCTSSFLFIVANNAIVLSMICLSLNIRAS